MTNSLKFNARMDIEDSNFSIASTEHGLNDAFSSFLKTVSLDHHWPLERDFDMHLCLQCMTNVVGLSEYLLHKLRECPKLRTLTVPSNKPKVAVKSSIGSCPTPVLDEQQLQPIQLTELDLGASFEIVDRKNEFGSPLDNDDDSKRLHLNLIDPSHEQGCYIQSPEKNLGTRPAFKTSKPYFLRQNNNALFCQPCGLPCASRTSLVYHLASSEHWRTSSKDPVHEQLILDHSAELAPLAPYKCTICPFYFNRLEDLANHFVKESEPHKKKLGPYRQLMCVKCSFRCRTIDELLMHLNRTIHKQKSLQNPVVVSGTDDFFCTRCNWTSKRQHALLFHIKLKHSGKIYCKECQITFEEEEAFNLHILETEHEKSIFNCALCPFFGRSKLSFQEHILREHHQDVNNSAGGTKRKLSMDTQHVSNSSAKTSYADVVQKFITTVDKLPRHAKLQMQKNRKRKEASSGLKGKDSSDPLFFVKFDGNRNSENREPFVIFVVDSAKDCTNFSKPKRIDEECGDIINSEHETPAEKSEAPRNLELMINQCQDCNLKFDNQKTFKNHLKLIHPEKLFHCEPCFSTFCSKAKLELHMKGNLHACNTKDVLDIEKGYLKSSTEFSCKYCAFHTATKAGILFHEVMHVQSNQTSSSTTLEGQILVNKEANKVLLEEKLLDVVITEQKSEERLSFGLANKDADQGILMTGSETEDGIYTGLHVIDDANEEQDNCLLDTGEKLVEGMFQPAANNNVSESQLPDNDDIVKNDSHVIGNVVTMASGKSIKPQKLYSCPICQESFTATKLRYHLIDHTGEQLFTCTICNASFSRKASLTSHEKDQHEIKKYSCPTCDFSTNQKIKYSEHLAIHVGDKLVQEFPCKTCGAKFSTSSAVKTHMLVHATNKGRPVHCTSEGCTRSFRYLSEMLYHKRIHCGDVNYLCEICDFATKSQHLLRKHERSHDEAKKHKCQYCCYVAVHSYHLNRHMRIHCQVKPFFCPHCTFTCNSQENLRRHILNSKKHPGLKVFLCRHCDFGCNHAEEMKRHMIKFHNEIAKQYNTDNATFASLVTGIFKPESDSKVSSEEPSSCIPIKGRHTKKNQTSKSPVAELNVCNSSDDIDWSQVHKTETSEYNPECEVDVAVENLVDLTKWQLETTDISVTSENIECHDDNMCSGDVVLNKNVWHCKLFDDTDITFAKEESVPMDVQEVTILAVADS